jgi:hypothetical protein
MKAVLTLILALMVAGGLTLMAPAQPTPQPAPTPAPPTALPPAATGWGYSYGVGGNSYFNHFQFQSQAAELVRKLANAKDEDEKSRLKEKLTEVLNQSFDEHMKQQQKELDQLEEQIRSLRALMKKRASNKNTIVERRIEQLIQDADGLGWNAPNAGFGHLEFTQPLQSIMKSAPKATTPSKKKTERSKDKDRKESDDENENDNDE